MRNETLVRAARIRFERLAWALILGFGLAVLPAFSQRPEPKDAEYGRNIRETVERMESGNIRLVESIHIAEQLTHGRALRATVRIPLDEGGKRADEAARVKPEPVTFEVVCFVKGKIQVVHVHGSSRETVTVEAATSEDQDEVVQATVVGERERLP